MSNEVSVLVPAEVGLRTQNTVRCNAFCVPSNFLYESNLYVGFASNSIPSSSVYLGVYEAESRKLVTWSNTITTGQYDTENQYYPFTYKLNSPVVVNSYEESPGFILAFFSNQPPDRFVGVDATPDLVEVTLRVGATIDDDSDVLWITPEELITTSRIRIGKGGSVKLRGDSVGYSAESGLAFQRPNASDVAVNYYTIPWAPFGLNSAKDVEGKYPTAYIRVKSTSNWATINRENSPYADIIGGGEYCKNCGWPGIYTYFYTDDDPDTWLNNPMLMTNGGALWKRGCQVYLAGETPTLVAAMLRNPSSVNSGAGTHRTAGEEFSLSNIGISTNFDETLYEVGSPSEMPGAYAWELGLDFYALSNDEMYLTFYGSDDPVYQNIAVLSPAEKSSTSYYGKNRKAMFSGGVDPVLSSLTLIKSLIDGSPTTASVLQSRLHTDGLYISVARPLVPDLGGFDPYKTYLVYASTLIDAPSEFVRGLGVNSINIPKWPLHYVDITVPNSANQFVQTVYNVGVATEFKEDANTLVLSNVDPSTAETNILDVFASEHVWSVHGDVDSDKVTITTNTEASKSILTVPYMFVRQPDGDAGDLVLLNSVGPYYTPSVESVDFYGNYIDIYAGQPVATFDSITSPDTPDATNGDAIAVTQTSNNVAWEQVMSKKFRNLYKTQGWVELLQFPMPDNWVWDSCSIKPDGGVYKLCGRIFNGKLEWQFGNLLDGNPPSADTEGYVTTLQLNPNTGLFEKVLKAPDGSIVDVTDGTEDAAIEDLDAVSGSTSMLADALSGAHTSAVEPLLRWAGKELSETNMLLNGKLRASCEPIYIGMFNMSGGFLAGGEFERKPGGNCTETCEAESVDFYQAVPEVSPVWFLFASVKDGFINLVALQHKIEAGEPLGDGISDRDITDPYELYGYQTAFGDHALDAPPAGYSKFNLWKYTNFITPPGDEIVYYNESPAPGYAPGWYYDGPAVSASDENAQKYYRIPDSLIEASSYFVPCPRWMEYHSVIDDDRYTVNVALCQFTEDGPIVLDNKSRSSRGFIDNTLGREYRWQKVGNTWKYVDYKNSSYVASIDDSHYNGAFSISTAYIPIGFRYSKTFAGYANYALSLVTAGKCMRIEPPILTVEGGGESYILDGVYNITTITEPVYSNEVFKGIDLASNINESVDSIAIGTGSVFAYNSYPENYNLEKIQALPDDIGDGIVVITDDADLVYENDINVYVIRDNAVSERVDSFTFGVVPSDKKSSTGNDFYVESVEGGVHTTYTGTLLLQYNCRLGVTFAQSRSSSISSFSNVVFDNAKLTIRNYETNLHNVTVPPEGKKAIIRIDSAADLPEISPPEPSIFYWIPSPEVSGEGFNLAKGIVDSTVLDALVAKIQSLSPSAAEGEPEVDPLTCWVAGTGQNYTYEERGSDVSIPAETEYGTESFSFLSRPHSNGEYVVMGVHLPVDATQIELHFHTDNKLGYSLWQYDINHTDGPSTKCLIENTYVSGNTNIKATFNGELVNASHLFVIWTSTYPGSGTSALDGTMVTVKDIAVRYSTEVEAQTEDAIVTVDSVDLAVPSHYVDEETGTVLSCGLTGGYSADLALESAGRASVTINRLRGCGSVIIQNQDVPARSKYYLDNKMHELGGWDKEYRPGQFGGFDKDTGWDEGDKAQLYINTNRAVTIQGIPTESGEPTTLSLMTLAVCDGSTLDGVGSEPLEKTRINTKYLYMGTSSNIGANTELVVTTAAYLGMDSSINGSLRGPNQSLIALGKVIVRSGASVDIHTLRIFGTLDLEQDAVTRSKLLYINIGCRSDSFNVFDQVPVPSSPMTLVSLGDDTQAILSSSNHNSRWRFAVKVDGMLSVQDNQILVDYHSYNGDGDRLTNDYVFKVVSGPYSGSILFMYPTDDYLEHVGGPCSYPHGTVSFSRNLEVLSTDSHIMLDDLISSGSGSEESRSVYYLEKYNSTEGCVRVDKTVITCCNELPYDCCEDVAEGILGADECWSCGNISIIGPNPCVGGSCGSNGNNDGNNPIYRPTDCISNPSKCGVCSMEHPENCNNDNNNDNGGGGGGGGGGGWWCIGCGDDDDDDDPTTTAVDRKTYYASVYGLKKGEGVDVKSTPSAEFQVTGKCKRGNKTYTKTFSLPAELVPKVCRDFEVTFLPTTVKNIKAKARVSIKLTANPESGMYEYPEVDNTGKITDCVGGRILYGMSPKFSGTSSKGAATGATATRKVTVVYKSAHRAGAAPASTIDAITTVPGITLGSVNVEWDQPVFRHNSKSKVPAAGKNSGLRFGNYTHVRTYTFSDPFNKYSKLELSLYTSKVSRSKTFGELVARSIAAFKLKGTVVCSGTITARHVGTVPPGCIMEPVFPPTITASQGATAVEVLPDVTSGGSISPPPKRLSLKTSSRATLDIVPELASGSAWDYCCETSDASGNSVFRKGRATPTVEGKITATVTITN